MNTKVADGRRLWPKEDSSKYKLEVSFVCLLLLSYEHNLDTYILAPPIMRFVYIHCEFPESYR
jgi:hypothetical protein